MRPKPMPGWRKAAISARSCWSREHRAAARPAKSRFRRPNVAGGTRLPPAPLPPPRKRRKADPLVKAVGSSRGRLRQDMQGAGAAGGYCLQVFRFCAVVAVLIGLALAAMRPAFAVDAVAVRTDAPAIDLTEALEYQRTENDRIQVSTAPGPDGIIRRIEVRGREGQTNWAVFALANNGDEQID